MELSSQKTEALPVPLEIFLGAQAPGTAGKMGVAVAVAYGCMPRGEVGCTQRRMEAARAPSPVA